jgi:hypothetical protein
VYPGTGTRRGGADGDARDVPAAGGLTATLERAALAAMEGAPGHALTVWLRGVAEPFRGVLPAAETRRVLALWGEQARAGRAELWVAD